jgi:hypothetical protein
MKPRRPSPSALFPPMIGGLFAVDGGLRIPPNSLKKWWPGTELNRRRQPFQGCALPPELPGHVSRSSYYPCGARGLFALRRLSWDCQPENSSTPNARNVVDYSKSRRSLKVNEAADDIAWAELNHAAESGPTQVEPLRCYELPVMNAAFVYCPPADEPCCPSQDASWVSCCDFRSTQLLMRSMDCR